MEYRYISGMDERTKPHKSRRARQRVRSSTRVKNDRGSEDIVLLKKLAAELKHDDDNAERLRAILRAALAVRRGATLAEMLDGGPDISGPEFDAVFEEIEQARQAAKQGAQTALDLFAMTEPLSAKGEALWEEAMAQVERDRKNPALNRARDVDL